MRSAVATLLLACALATGAGVARADIAPDLGGVPVDGPEYRTAKARYDQTAADLAAAIADRTAAEGSIARLTADDAALTARIERDTAAENAAAAELTVARHNVKVIAITSYIRGSEDADAAAVDATDDPATVLAAESNQILFSTVRESQVDRARAAQAAYDAAATRLDGAVSEQAEVRDRLATVTHDRESAAAAEARLTNELAERAVELAAARATATVVGVDFPLVALDAYYAGASALAQSRPECGIAWSALAGITRVESKHGRFGGSQLLATGATTQPIIGIPLDGNNGTALIPDTDGGELDGDIDFDRAVGPMQFIPSTWRRWATDGNDDGVADPHNIYDAAVTAGRYLCAGGPMQSDEEMAAGFLRYNHSEAYAQAVLSFTHQYAALVIPPPT